MGVARIQRLRNPLDLSLEFDVSKDQASEQRTALITGVSCYLLWGFLPLYFHLLIGLGVGPFEMIGHRLIWSAPFALIAVLLAAQGSEALAAFRQPRVMGLLGLSTAAILVNWTVYVVAVTHGKVIEASLGYYINPLMNMAAGALLFRERISREGAIAIGLAAIGVAIQAAALGHLPLMSLTLGFSFCVYAVIRKQVAASAQTGLFIECLYLLPIGLGYIGWLQASGGDHALKAPTTALLLLLAGPATVVPLALFAWSARRLPMTAIGFLQFLAPTIQFLIGLSFGESFTRLRGLSFLFIWAGVVVFIYGAWRRTRPVDALAATDKVSVR